MSERPPEFEFAYFVSYSHRKGFGSGEWWRKAPIESYDDVQAIARDIEAGDEVEGVIILNWIRYPGRQHIDLSPSSADNPDGSPVQQESAAETNR